SRLGACGTRARGSHSCGARLRHVRPARGATVLPRREPRVAELPIARARGAMSTCGLCHLDENPDQRVVLRDRTVLFLQNEKEQGALVGSGVIIPVRHAETVFDLTPDEVAATFALLARVKAWMDERYHPD